MIPIAFELCGAPSDYDPREVKNLYRVPTMRGWLVESFSKETQKLIRSGQRQENIGLSHPPEPILQLPRIWN
jgi:hypothetical protein